MIHTAPTRQFVAYLRVSTAQQGRSGLGLEAQRAAVATYVAGQAGQLVAEFEEVETGKGAAALELRPQLRAALTAAKKAGAVLVIAKLDRLARNVHFVSGLMESGCEFVAADMPQANKTMLHMHAVMSEWERDQISARTKAALAAVKARGVRLGTKGAENLASMNASRVAGADAQAERLRGTLAGYVRAGYSQRRMAAELAALNVPTARGGVWTQVQVGRLLARLGLAAS